MKNLSNQALFILFQCIFVAFVVLGTVGQSEFGYYMAVLVVSVVFGLGVFDLMQVRITAIADSPPSVLERGVFAAANSAAIVLLALHSEFTLTFLVFAGGLCTVVAHSYADELRNKRKQLELTYLSNVARKYSEYYASPQHFTLSTIQLRSLIEEVNSKN